VQLFELLGESFGDEVVLGLRSTIEKITQTHPM
jgi:hypothetical protein